jgi:hypothetical protein
MKRAAIGTKLGRRLTSPGSLGMSFANVLRSFSHLG